MSLGAALTEFTTTTKQFSWKIDNFNLVSEKSFEVVEYSYTERPMLSNVETECTGQYFLLKSPIMTATNPSTGLQHSATISLKFDSFPGRYATILMDCNPPFEKAQFFYQFNDGIEKECDADCNVFLGLKEEEEKEEEEDDDESETEEAVIKTITIFVNVVTKRCETFEITPFKVSTTLGIANRLKAMWENVESVQCLIKCGNVEIKAIKPILAASSPVFSRMFESEMKEKSENCVEIKEFKPEIVAKMIEFCENDDIKEYKDCEEDIFKIAHKYQISDLMVTKYNFAVEKMVESVSISNIESRLQLANLYELKEFKKWCMQFVIRNNIEIEY